MLKQTNTGFNRIALGCVVYLLLMAAAAPVIGRMGASPYNPPEFYDRIRALRKSIIEEQRENIDLSTHPRYRTIVTNTEKLLRVERLTTWFEVNRQNGVVDRVGLLDVVCDNQCAFGDLEVTDENGRVYRQSAYKNGSVTVDDQNTYLYWTVNFSPVGKNGKTLPVKIEAKYMLYKLGGLVTVHYKVLEGSAKIKQLVTRNSAGKLPAKLNIAHSAFFKDNEGKFNDTRSEEVPDLKSRVIMTGKVVAPFWTDGRIGFEGVALRETWSQMGPFDAQSEMKRTVVSTRNKQRSIDFYFVNTDSPVPLKKGRKLASGFAFMPFQKYRPRLPLVDNTVDLEVQYEYFRTGDDKELIRDLRRAYWNGAIFSGGGLAGAGWVPLMYAVTKEPYRERTQHILDLGRECELVLGTASCVVNNFPGIPGYSGNAGNEEVNAALPEFLEAIEKEGFTSLSTPEVRDFWLDIRTSTLDVFDVDADYEDLHAHIDVGKNFDSQVEGELRYLEDIALLHEHYGRDKLIIAHAGTIYTVADGLNGATWPGEPWSSQNFKQLPLPVLDSLLNPFLIGTDVCFYGLNDIYDPESLQICKQILRNAAVPMYATLVKQFGGSRMRPFIVKSEAAQKKWQRYFVPGRTFRTDKAEFVSWRDPAVSSFFTVADPDHKVNLYYRDNEAYATCVDLDEQPVKPKLAFNVANLGFKGAEVFVFDIIPRKLTVASVKNGWIKYKPAEATAEPVLIYLKDKLNDDPEIIWANFPLRFEKTKSELTDASVTWKCHVPVYPLEQKHELVRVYVGNRGRPRSYVPYSIANVDDFYRDQKSMDIIIDIPAATEGGPIGGPGAAGPDAISGVLGLKWDKTFQLSFPYLGEN